ncbi:hypothetical protein VKS41_001123 [Umbelopsis sp. WA50703]
MPTFSDNESSSSEICQIHSDINSIITSEIIDLQSDPADRLDQFSQQALANVLSAAIQLSAVPVNQRSSLSSGRASVVLPTITSDQAICRRDSGSSVSSNDSSSPKTPTSNRRLSSFFGLNIKRSSWQQRNQSTCPLNSNEDCNQAKINDGFGLQDLLDRGIQVKEITVTKKKMVVPDDILNPMPSISVARPSFARIN